MLKHQLLLKRLRHQQRLQQLRRALHHKLQQHQKQQVQRLQLLLKLHKHRLPEAAPATNSSEAEKPRVRSRRAVPSAAPTSATEASTKNVSTSIEAGDEYVTIRTDSASTVKVTVDGQEVSINGADGVYTFKRPSAGGTVVATATDASGKNATKQLIVSPSTVNGVIKPSDSSLTITNKFDTTGITTDKEPPYVVKNAGVEFNKVNDDGTISLTGTSWTRLAGGWAKDKAFLWSSYDFELPKIQPSMKILKNHNKTNLPR